MKHSIFECQQFSVEQCSGVFKVGTDAVLLASMVQPRMQSAILEVGSGTGIISLIVAQRFAHSHITAIDISEDAYNCTYRNFKNSPWTDRLQCYNASLQKFAYNYKKSKFDIIVSNPPFFKNSLLSPHDYKNIARHDLHLPVCELFESSHCLLHNNGTLWVIIPFSELSYYDECAETFKFKRIQSIEISPFQHQNPNRCIAVYCKTQEDVACEISEFYIRNDKKEYSLSYNILVKKILKPLKK